MSKTAHKHIFSGDHTAKPIDPSPNMTTVDPASTFAVLHAAPTPENQLAVNISILLNNYLNLII